MNEPKYLPIGTVVMLQGGKKRAMIIGFCPIADENKMYDYSGCLYPEGVLSSDQTLLFNHDQIVQVYAKGYVDEEQTNFMVKLNQIVAQIGQPVPTPAAGTRAVSQPQAPSVPAGVAPVQSSPQQAPMQPMPQMPVGQVPVPNIPVKTEVPVEQAQQ